MASKISTLLILSIAFLAISAEAVQAQVTAKQKQQIASMREDLAKAGKLYVDGKFKESAAVVEKLQTAYVEAATGANRKHAAELSPIYNSLVRAHALLELEGIRLPALKDPAALPAEPEPADPTPSPMPQPAADGVSFVKQVAPILMTKCGGCHVRDTKGKFGMATFADLMRGSAAGAVIFKGDASGSRLIEVIETGDMPRGGGKLSAEQFTTLKTWINEGAKFDGTDARASIATLAAATNAPAAAPAVMQATGNGTVSFARDLAPVLAENCLGCHGTNRPRSNLNMTNFTSLLRGGDGGSPIAPGKPAMSLLIGKLKGTADGQQMPLNADPLSNEVIAKFETWIREGAQFDAPSPSAPLGRIAAMARAQGATHEQLSADREELAEKNWKLGLPGVIVHHAETENFYVVGNRLENSLKEIGQQAEEIAPQVLEIFAADKDKPLVKGRMTLFVFDSRYDYSEFGQMVERRRLPNEWRGHWNFTTVDAYGALVPSRSDQYKIEPLLAQQLAGVYVASTGADVPEWFAEGAGRVAASRLASDDPRVASWDDSLPAVISQMKAPNDFLQGRLPPEASSIASYSFVKFLMADAPKFRAVLNSLREGKDFATSFSAAYGGSPDQVSARWGAKVSRRR